LPDEGTPAAIRTDGLLPGGLAVAGAGRGIDGADGEPRAGQWQVVDEGAARLIEWIEPQGR